MTVTPLARNRQLDGAPTLHGRDGARSEKLQGPRGLIGVGIGTSQSRTFEPSGGVSGALGVPTEEASPAEAPSAEDPEANGTEAMEQGEISNDVEMDFVGHVQNS